MSKLTTVTERKITFEAELYQVSKLGAFSRDRLEAMVEPRIEFQGMLHTLSTEILQRKLVEDKYRATFTYKVPSSWWQQFKKEKTPKWFTCRYPVQFTSKVVKRTINITRKATYPMADIVLPKNMGKVIIRDHISPTNFYEGES